MTKKTQPQVYDMRIFEIIQEKSLDINSEFRKFFIEEIMKNTDKNILKFLLENPLYRADFPPEENEYFGKKKYPKSRPPLDNPKALHELLENFLEEKGFEARRKNSIFVSSDKDLVEKFHSIGRKIYVIFPAKKFHFTWNKVIDDFYYETIIHADPDVLEIDYEKILDSVLKDLIDFIHTFVSRYGDYREENDDNDDNMEFSKPGIIKSLEKIMENPDLKRDLTINMLKYISNLENPPKDIISLNKNSLVMKSFSKSNFFDAVSSGHEIMLTNRYYYYVTENLFEANLDYMKRALNKL